MTLAEFLHRWSTAAASERANKDAFCIDICRLLNVPPPNPSTGNPEQDTYAFEADALKRHAGKANSVGKIDLYKEGCFILEAKQGSDGKSKKRGTAKRNTPVWTSEMQAAHGQALQYANSFDAPPVFLIVTDIGYCLDLYACFDGSRQWHPFPNAQTNRVFLTDLETPFKDRVGTHLDLLRTIWTDPKSLDPSLHAAKVTREVAEKLAELAKTLDASKHEARDVATFLMRCLFTMFAEDVGLLPPNVFKDALQKMWIPNPASFVDDLSAIWAAMNDGSRFGFTKFLKFNGGLFQDQKVLPLTKPQLQLLYEAAACDWSAVEPSIFGTLLERALDPKERHRLGAHYTPRAYVERLVRPTIEEPLREEWDNVRAQVLKLLNPEQGKKAKSEAARQKDQAKREEQARELVREFHRRLSQTRVLDPACGTGNFLYVTLDLFKRLETEVLKLLHDLGDTQTFLGLDSVSVTPKQFLGIEVKPWAKEIAELVLWIGYLQWNFKTRRKGELPPEPVLRDYHNIECRDALLTWDRIEPVLDEHGKPVTRWDGETMKKSPVTGEEIPDESARVPVVKYVNPRKAEWPEAAFIVGNPPFVGNWKMRQTLGTGYTEALRTTYGELPETTEFVLYWWKRAAEECLQKGNRQFGFITTKTLAQSHGRKVIQQMLETGDGISIVYAIPNHPWVDAADGADVRIAMTVGAAGKRNGVLQRVIAETTAVGVEPEVVFDRTVGIVHADLRVGANVQAAQVLQSNSGLCCPGVKLHGAGFIVSPDIAMKLGLGSTPGVERVIKPYRNGKDLAATPRNVLVIDLFGLDAQDTLRLYPAVYQHVFEHVKPERDQNNRAIYRENWWIFGEPRANFRPALRNISRFIATIETSKHRTFSFLDSGVVPDNKLIAVAHDDGAVLGVLSSRVHCAWALVSGGRLGVGDDPVYVKTRCFDPFPFPACTDAQKQRIRDLGEQLDAHRKRQQAAHPGLTITGMYNVLEKLRSGEALNEKEKVIHQQGLVSVLKQLHDDLDAAVFDAYGWPHDLTDEQLLERLVALNAERAEEERQGLIRWLRPEFQNPSGRKAETQVEIASVEEAEESAPVIAAPAWPKKPAEQTTAVRDLVRKGGAWTSAQVVSSFKGATAESIENELDRLGELGLLMSWEEQGTRFWQWV